MIRPFRAETERYGHYSVAGEYVYDHPFQWGSKRTGPDLHRVGGRYSDEWQRAHLMNPRDVVPESNMPAFAFLANTKAKTTVGADIEKKMQVMQMFANMRKLPTYSDADIKGAKAAIGDMTEMDVLIAYLQGMGTALSSMK
jgi:cytochrome c oxidase cbb3-type subunit 2